MAKRVIIIDDDENTVKFLSVLLEEHGYETLSAYDGREGLQKIIDSEVDLIILDVMMPRKTGFVVFKQLKRDEKLRDIPVLMLTGVAASLDNLDESSETPYDSLREALRQAIRKMREEGAVRPEMFVDKPVNPDALVAKIQSLIGN